MDIIQTLLQTLQQISRPLQTFSQTSRAPLTCLLVCLNNFLTTYSAVINMYFFFHRCSHGVWWTWWWIFITGVPEWNCLGQTAPEIWQSSSCHGCAPLPLDATTKRRDNSHEWSIKNVHSFTCNVTQLIFTMFGCCCKNMYKRKECHIIDNLSRQKIKIEF